MASSETSKLRSRSGIAACGIAAMLLAGCGTVDGPGRPLSDPGRSADAVPRIETLRAGGPNKPYVVRGVAYTPLTADVPLRQHGLASWYGRKFHGRPTANGEIYDMYAMTAAHKTMPLPSYARVRNPANGREVIVRVNDRGPFVEGRIIDLSYAAAARLDLLRGVAPVVVERITHDEIRAGVAAPARQPEVWWLQLGAFRDEQGARQLQRLLHSEAGWLAPRLVLAREGALTRIRSGPYASRAEAERDAARLAQALPIAGFVVNHGDDPR